VRIASLGSGSHGNGTLVEDDGSCVLIDLGFTLKESVRRLQRLGRSPEDVSAILVTHEHADHILGVSAFARKFGTPVYMTPGTRHLQRAEILPKLFEINCHRPFAIGNMVVTPVTVPHDAKEPCQYVLVSAGRRVGVLTDLGHITPHVRQQYAQCDALLLECNHDRQMLTDGPYPWPLKQRVGGMQGHLNNEQAATLLTTVDLSRLQQLIICHISETNNQPELALTAVQVALKGWAGDLRVAEQEAGFCWIEVQ
jgi:phosphoribosyl 1,2-cyclic phosphodiesterase